MVLIHDGTSLKIIGNQFIESQSGSSISTIGVTITTLPTLNETGQYVWESKNLKTGNIIQYLVDPKYSHYSANLYDYEAYKVNTYI